MSIVLYVLFVLFLSGQRSMMKRFLLISFFSISFSYACEYAAHQYHYIDTIPLSQCLDDAKKAFKDNGFEHVKIFTENSP